MCYHMKHETSRYWCGFGKAEASGHSPLRIGPNVSLGSCHGRVLSEFGCAMAPVVSERGQRWTSSEENTWTSFATVSSRQGEDCRDFGKGALGGGLFDKSVDIEASGRGDRAGVWYPIHTNQLVEVDACPRMELSEAREKSPRARRSVDSALETLPVAAYKKRLIDWALISYFLTKAAFPCSPMLPEHGHPEARRRCCVSRGIGQKYLRYLRLVFLLCGSALLSIQLFILGRISGSHSWLSFSAILLGILGVILFFSGTEVVYTGRALFGRCCANIVAFMSIISLPMLLSLILMSLSGHNLKELSQMPSPMTWGTSGVSYVSHYADCAVLNGCYGLACERLNYRGLNLVPIN